MTLFRRRSADEEGERKGARLVTYADWSLWFEAFAKGGDDDGLLAQAVMSNLNVSSATIDNIGRRATETLDQRLAGVGAMLQTGLRCIVCEQDAVRAILNARGAFVLLRRYAELPCWPATMREALSGLIDQHVAERQKNLLRNAAEDRTGRLVTAIRNNPLDRVGLVPPRTVTRTGSDPAEARATGGALDSTSQRRRILI